MNKPVLYSLTLAALAGTVSPLSAQQAPESTDKRPNIILFMVDDMGCRIPPCHSGPKKPIITVFMRLLIWSVWPNKG